MSSMLKGAAKGAAKSAAIGAVTGQAADENSKLGGFLKKGKAVAGKAINESPMAAKATQAAEDAVKNAINLGPLGDVVAKHIVGEAKKDPKKMMSLAKAASAAK
eukprot:m.257380 g.257380  ORF g.257380 m.257380 type:complete len:104 (-) comp26588_c0_seq2:211-522(-)